VRKLATEFEKNFKSIEDVSARLRRLIGQTAIGDSIAGGAQVEALERSHASDEGQVRAGNEEGDQEAAKDPRLL
jgi:hypothetical protein